MSALLPSLVLMGLLIWADACSAHRHTRFARVKKKAGSQSGNHFYVSKMGNANFDRIQDAIDSIPEYNEQWVQIDIAAGVYHEKVVILYKKPFISLQGAGLASTTIINSQTASKSGTADSATFTVWAPNFVARGIGFVNAAPPSKPGTVNEQAVAVLLAADKAAFYGCGMYGGQDTLFDYAGRHYFKDSNISDTIDFIFGNAKSVFKEQVKCIWGERGGHILEQSTSILSWRVLSLPRVGMIGAAPKDKRRFIMDNTNVQGWDRTNLIVYHGHMSSVTTKLHNICNLAGLMDRHGFPRPNATKHDLCFD